MSERARKKSTAYKNKFNTDNYDSLRIVIPRGRKADVERYAKDHLESVNGLVGRLLRRELSMSEEQWKARADDCTPETATPMGNTAISKDE